MPRSFEKTTPETSTFHNFPTVPTVPMIVNCHLEGGPYIDESHVVTTFHATTQMGTNLGRPGTKKKVQRVRKGWKFPTGELF